MKNYKKGIIFLTTNDRNINVLQKLLDVGEIIHGLIFPFKAKNEEKINILIKFAEKNDISWFRPKRAELSKTIESIGHCEFLITAGYPYILNAQDLMVCKFNINIHPTLLPKYRGPNIEWYVIANGDKEAGVTIHFLDEVADKGSIIEQKVIPLTKFDTIYSLLRKTAIAEPDLLVSSLHKVRNGEPVKIQDESQATYYNELRTPAHSELDPSKSLNELYNFIRACDPERFPAFFYVDNEKVAVKLFRPDKPKTDIDLI